MNQGMEKRLCKSVCFVSVPDESPGNISWIVKSFTRR